MVEGAKVLEIEPESKDLHTALGITEERRNAITQIIANSLADDVVKKRGHNVVQLLVKGSAELNHPNELAFFTYALRVAMNETEGLIKKGEHVEAFKLDSIKGLIEYLRNANKNKKP